MHPARRTSSMAATNARQIDEVKDIRKSGFVVPRRSYDTRHISKQTSKFYYVGTALPRLPWSRIYTFNM